MGKKRTQQDSSISYPKNLRGKNFFKLELDPEQEYFRDCIWDENNIIIFCDANSGTGKTTVAAATAHLLMEYGRYSGIVYIASPYAEKTQGYLPGTLGEKSEPYFQPFYQALEEIERPVNYGVDNIECCTHTFLRGINFKDKVVIIDESQNFTSEELKKVLTRIHDSCKVIVIGHRGQIDLEKSSYSGFVQYLDYYRQYENTNKCKICSLTTNHRGWLSTTADNIY